MKLALSPRRVFFDVSFPPCLFRHFFCQGQAPLRHCDE